MTTTTLYSTAEAAKRLGITPGRIRQILMVETIGTKIGRDWVFTDEDIERLKSFTRSGRPRKEEAGTR